MADEHNNNDHNIIHESCGCVVRIHEYDDFGGERFRSKINTCDNCRDIKIQQNIINIETNMIDEKKQKHLDAIRNMITTGNNQRQLKYLLVRILESQNIDVEVRKLRQFRKMICSDIQMMSLFRITKVNQRYYCDADIVDQCDLNLLFSFK